MPTNTPIPTHSTGDYLSSTDWNTLPKLNTAIGLYGVTAASDSGTPPSTTGPNFLMQAGVQTGTTSASGIITITYPNAFPTGTLICMVTSDDVSIASDIVFEGTHTAFPATASVYNLQCRTGSTGATLNNTLYRVNFLAIGF